MRGPGVRGQGTEGVLAPLRGQSYREAHDVHTQSATRVDTRTYAALGGLLTTLVVPVNSRRTNKLFLLVSEKGLVSSC